MTRLAGCVVVVGAVLALTAVSTVAAAQPDGSLDPSFGDNGIVELDLGSVWDSARAVIPLADGSVLVAAEAGPTSGPEPGFCACDFLVVKLSADGHPDAAFGSGGIARATVGGLGMVNDIGLLPDGRIIVAGVTQYGDPAGEYGPATAVAVAFGGDGSPDTAFGGSGVVAVPQISSLGGLAIDAAGNIVLAGSQGVPRGDGTFNHNVALARVKPDGTLDDTFGTRGVAAVDLGDSEAARDVVIDRHGRVLAAGYAQTVPPGGSATTALLLIALEGSGRLDTSFGQGGHAIADVRDFDDAHSVTLQGSDAIVVAGSTRREAGDLDVVLARYTRDGLLDPAFGSGGLVVVDIAGGSFDTPTSIAAQADHKLVVLAHAWSVGQGASTSLLRFESSGVADTSFGDAGSATIGDGTETFGADVAVDEADRLLVGGSIGDAPDFMVARLLAEPDFDGRRFVDDDLTLFERDIAFLGAAGITKGCNPPANDWFCPDDHVTRGQMAAFLVRALGLTARLDNPFVDDDRSIFQADIEKLAAAGITRGCNPPVNDRFCPDQRVTREQMAAFLVRALGLTQRLDDPFTDDDGSIFEADIEKLAAAGITRGCNPPENDLFCPKSHVTRGQMAAFLHRALG